MAAIGEREEELRSITDRLLEPRPGSLRAKLDELRTFAVSRLTKIRELLAHPEDVEKAHKAIAERVGQLTLEATNENGKRTYLAHGNVDFSVKRIWRIPVVPGARIELATPAFSGRRSTTELPRQWKI